MALTGRPDEPGLMAPPDVIAGIVALGERAGTEALALLGERAAIAGLSRGGSHSCGGSGRLLAAADGWLAVTLARDDDLAAVPAWLEVAADDDPWALVEAALARRSAVELVERGRLLGLPVAMVGSVALRPSPGPGEAEGLEGLPVQVSRFPVPERRPQGQARPLVVDLSSLWAGPLCSRLLGRAGARVIKVESIHRPDGARRGPAAFFDLLHAGQESVALDFGTSTGRGRLRSLLRGADVVIEASRPRALAALGLAAEDLLAAGEGPKAWVSITGYGRTGPGRDRVAFGDDAAAAGGLVAWDRRGPCFVADAIADPLAGMAATAAVRALLDTDGAWLIDVAMAEVAAHVAGAAGRSRATWPAGGAATPPTAPPPPGPGPTLGEHTAAVLAEGRGAARWTPAGKPGRDAAQRSLHWPG